MTKGVNAYHFDTHLNDAKIEDLEFLLSTGVQIDVALKRVGASRATMLHLYEKRGKRAPWLDANPA